ncbi:DUF4386 domain-containing protein [Phenylobacterium sp.]|uniref:DUF4386 domain-containing protein n=1 Tax=Phenylobacterium sp. TaxID=1871053 RepID=UPI002FC9D5A3
MSDQDDTTAGPGRITPAQHRAAKWVGAILVVAMATSMFAQLYLLRGLETRSAEAMAASVAAMEGSYRAGTLIHLLTFATDAAMAAALYVVLTPVNRGLALLGAFWRLVDCAILVLMTLMPFAIIRLLSGADYLAGFTTAETQGLARWLYGVQADGMKVGWTFLGLGSAVFAVLWLKSRYVPWVLPAWGVAASLLMAMGALVNLVRPGAIPMWGYMAPMFFYEVPLGLWLLLRRLREPST